jgi:DNA ligase (NAD+)
MDELQAATEDDLSNVEEVGPVIAASVHDFIHSKRGDKAIQKLKTAGVDMTAPKKARTATESGPLAGKTLVVTGTLSKYTREEIEALIVQYGGRAANSISKKTDYLIAGDKAGSKLEKATKLGVPILSESEFDQLIGND